MLRQRYVHEANAMQPQAGRTLVRFYSVGNEFLLTLAKTLCGRGHTS